MMFVGLEVLKAKGDRLRESSSMMDFKTQERRVANNGLNTEGRRGPIFNFNLDEFMMEVLMGGTQHQKERRRTCPHLAALGGAGA